MAPPVECATRWVWATFSASSTAHTSSISVVENEKSAGRVTFVPSCPREVINNRRNCRPRAESCRANAPRPTKLPCNNVMAGPLSGHLVENLRAIRRDRGPYNRRSGLRFGHSAPPQSWISLAPGNLGNHGCWKKARMSAFDVVNGCPLSGMPVGYYENWLNGLCFRMDNGWSSI